MRFIHIFAGSLGLLAGYLALSAAKGGRLHRKSGTVFVYAMLTMALFGLIITLGHPWQFANGSAALITAYLITTSLLTVRPVVRGARQLDAGLMMLAFAICAVCFNFAAEAVANGGQTAAGIPAFPFFLFGTFGLLGFAGDLRMLRRGAPTGGRRLARHLWRMCTALFIAAMSFFIGQADAIPKPIRIYPLLAMPVLIVVVTMVYWLWRVRRRSRHSESVIPGSVISASVIAGSVMQESVIAGSVVERA